MSDTTIAASLQLNGADQANQSVKSFKAQLKEANTELIKIQEQFGATSKEAIEAAKKVANLKDSIQDASEVAGLFDPGAKFQAFGNVLRTVAGGFSALTGTMALFGSESKDVEKAILKVQAALAITEGVNTIVDSAKDFERLKAVIANTSIVQKTFATATTLTDGAMKALGVSTTATSTGFKVLRGAIIATGIGALVAGLGMLVANFDKVKEYMLKLFPGLEKLGAFFSKITNAVTDFVGATSQAGRDLDNFTNAVKRNNDNIEKRIQVLSAQGGKEAEIYKLRKKQIDDEIGALDRKFTLNKKLDEDEANRLKELRTQSLVLDAEEKNRRIKEAEDAKKRSEAAKKESDEKKAKALEYEQFLKEHTLYVKGVELKTQTDITAIVEKGFQDRMQKTHEGLLANMALTNEVQSQINEELAFSRLSEVDRERLELEMWYNEKLELLKKHGGDTTMLTEEYERRQTEITKAENQRRVALVGGLLGQAANLLGKHTAAGKVMAVAQATIDTYQGAISAYKSMAGIPVVGPGLGIAAAATAVGLGLKNIKEIMKVKTPGGSGGGMSMPSVSVDAPLRPQRAQETSTRLPQEQINQIGNATVKAFVVESDITNNQERISRLNRQRRLGG